jgi:hypothetical protein
MFSAGVLEIVSGVVMRQLFIVTLAFGICASPALAQQAGGNGAPAQTAAAAPAPQSTTEAKLEAGATWIESIFGEKSKNGFYPEFGGLPPGSGISAGPGYHTSFSGATRSSMGRQRSRGRVGRSRKQRSNCLDS